MAKKENIELDNIESLLYIKIKSSNDYGGYKSDILLNKLSGLEENFLICNACKGLMRDACSINSGQKLKCRPCLKGKETGYPLETANLTIEQLSCKCPLSKRGCEWIGVISEVYKHTDTCQYIIVECSYVKFGCRQILKRLDIPKHREDNKDYHSEIVSVFMGTRVEQLETENKLQCQTISELERKLKIAESKITETNIMLQEAIHKNKITWEIDKYQVYAKLKQLGLAIENENVTFTKWWSSHTLHSSNHHVYDTYPIQFYLKFSKNNISFNIRLLAGSSITNGTCILPFEANVRMALISMENSENSVVHEPKKISLGDGGTILIADIPSKTIIEKQFSNEKYVTFRIEFEQA